MKHLDIEGAFWLDSNPDDQVPGRLTFNQVDGAELKLMGEFPSTKSLIGKNDLPLPRIFGVGDGSVVTLIDCLPSIAGMSIPGMLRQKFYPGVILSGAHIGSDQPNKFNSMHLEINHLKNWVGLSGISASSGQSYRDGLEVKYTPIGDQTTEFSMGKLSMSIVPAWSWSFDKVIVGETVYLSLEFNDPMNIDDIYGIARSVGDLLTIAANAPAQIMRLSLTHNSIKGSDGSRKSIEVYARTNTVEPKRDIHRTHMLFDYRSIGRIEGIASWLQNTEPFRVATDSLLAHMYLPQMYENLRFIRIAVASESLAKRLFEAEGQFSFKENLEKLLQYAGGNLINQAFLTNGWTSRIREYRNKCLHGSSIEDDKVEELYWLGQSLYALVVLCLLKKAGVDEGVLSSIPPFSLFREALPESEGPASEVVQ